MLFIQVLTNVLAAVTGYISATGDLHKKKYSPTTKGWFLILLFLLCGGLNILYSEINDNNSEKKAMNDRNRIDELLMKNDSLQMGNNILSRKNQELLTKSEIIYNQNKLLSGQIETYQASIDLKNQELEELKKRVDETKPRLIEKGRSTEIANRTFLYTIVFGANHGILLKNLYIEILFEKEIYDIEFSTTGSQGSIVLGSYGHIEVSEDKRRIGYNRNELFSGNEIEFRAKSKTSNKVLSIITRPN